MPQVEAEGMLVYNRHHAGNDQRGIIERLVGKALFIIPVGENKGTRAALHAFAPRMGRKSGRAAGDNDGWLAGNGLKPGGQRRYRGKRLIGIFYPQRNIRIIYMTVV